MPRSAGSFGNCRSKRPDLHCQDVQRQDHVFFPGVQDAKAAAEKVADKVKEAAPEAPKRLDASSIGAALQAAPEPTQAIESGAHLITPPGRTAHSVIISES